jgi:hypothetical protein
MYKSKFNHVAQIVAVLVSALLLVGCLVLHRNVPAHPSGETAKILSLGENLNKLNQFLTRLDRHITDEPYANRIWTGYLVELHEMQYYVSTYYRECTLRERNIFRGAIGVPRFVYETSDKYWTLYCSDEEFLTVLNQIIDSFVAKPFEESIFTGCYTIPDELGSESRNYKIVIPLKELNEKTIKEFKKDICEAEFIEFIQHTDSLESIDEDLLLKSIFT